MLPGIASQSVVRLRGRVMEDNYHNTIIDWASPLRRTVAGCSLQPVVGDEFNQGRDTITTRWNLFMPPAADVKALDRVEYAAAVYEVDGSVQEWTDTTGANLSYKQCVLRRFDG